MSYPIPVTEQDSYGTVSGVAAYTGVYTDDGVYNVLTNPTYERVVLWIDQVSDMFNVALASAGFQTPIVQVDAKLAISAVVEQVVSDLAHAANSKGRFFTSKFQGSATSIMSQVMKDIQDWVDMNAVGLTNLGIPRVTGTIGNIGYKSHDAEGESVTPIFQRKAFGNNFTDWTKSG
jgi:hypothetical protein